MTGVTFDLFWLMYPRKVAKLAASKAWAKLTAAECEKALAVLPDHIASWSDRSMEHVPHAASWLNGHRFDDELTPARAVGPLRLVAKLEPAYDWSWIDDCREKHGGACHNPTQHDIKVELESKATA